MNQQILVFCFSKMYHIYLCKNSASYSTFADLVQPQLQLCFSSSYNYVCLVCAYICVWSAGGVYKGRGGSVCLQGGIAVTVCAGDKMEEVTRWSNDHTVTLRNVDSRTPRQLDGGDGVFLKFHLWSLHEGIQKYSSADRNHTAFCVLSEMFHCCHITNLKSR